jgi:hypothetical protein
MMIILSFNARGIGGPQEKLSLKMLLLILNPNLILIQEMMCPGEKATEIFSSWLKN